MILKDKNQSDIVPTKISSDDAASLVVGNRRIRTTLSDFSDSDSQSTSSFFYDQAGSPLKSTQQLRVDWSSFVNHTFFQSAVSKTNVAFDKLINEYPFDGTQVHVERFLQGLTGYENWVLENFPKSIGYAQFSGSHAEGTSGNYFEVKDSVGYLFPNLYQEAGKSILDPKTKSFTIEAHVYVPSEANDLQMIFQKVGSGSGINLGISSSASPTSVILGYSINSGSRYANATLTITKGVFNHVAFVYDRERITAYLNGVSTSVSAIEVFDTIDTGGTSAYVCTGSAYYLGSNLVTPRRTFSGSIDELRFFHSERSESQIRHYMTRNVRKDANNELQLCFRFNEPGDSIAAAGSTYAALVLDYSGNGLHSLVNENSIFSRVTGSAVSINTLTNEKELSNPILFPKNSRVIDFNVELVDSGSLYDAENPNLITKLVPYHYLLEGQEQDSTETIAGGVEDYYTGTSVPGTGDLGSSQLMVQLLNVYGKFYDEMKLFADSFSKIKHVHYEEDDSVPDTFLPQLAKAKGLELPQFFASSKSAQYVNGQMIVSDEEDSEYSLKEIQNKIHRRFLTSAREIVQSKGTVHGVKAYFRSLGIDPDNTFIVKERGGPTESDIENSRQKRIDVIPYANLTGSNVIVSTTYLSSSRTEVGIPSPIGTFVLASTYSPHGVSNSVHDGLWTSGSWTIEQRIKKTNASIGTNSIGRLWTTGSLATSSIMWSNVIATSGSNAKVSWHFVPATGSSLQTLYVDADVYDGNSWYVAYGRGRSDLTGSLDGSKSTHFLYVAKQSDGEVDKLFSTSSFVETDPLLDLQQRISSSFNASGSWWSVGSGETAQQGTHGYLNDSSRSTSYSETEGAFRIGNMRFWSKQLTPTEMREHVKNPFSFGTENPVVNFGGLLALTGAFQRERIETFIKQDTNYASAAGAFEFVNSAPNSDATVTATGYSSGSYVFSNDYEAYSYTSPSFDEATTDNKVRIRGYEDSRSREKYPWEDSAPARIIDARNEAHDDPRVTIEMGLSEVVNRDMFKLVGDTTFIADAIGKQENSYEESYDSLERLGDAYSARTYGKFEYRKYFEFFRWIDAGIGNAVKKLMPRKARFDGIKFVIEPISSERAKLRYLPPEQTFAEIDTMKRDDGLLLQQVTGRITKF